MSGEFEIALRSVKAYDMAREAIEMMETAKVWPTALNFELWLHLVADPSSPLASELQRLIQSGEPITDVVAEDLAQIFLPKARLHEQIRDAGDLLTKELATVSRAIQAAQKSSVAYGERLAGAREGLDKGVGEDGLKGLVENLTEATAQVQQENKKLERQLAESTSEVRRLREHLLQVRRDATTDGLTNLSNRKAFDEELERACADADAQGSSLHLAVLDIDHFKQFNDTWGHQTGDQVIRYVASVIGRAGAPPRFAARYGGEEFALIFSGESAPRVQQTLDEIRDEISSRRLKRRSTNDELGTVTISAGFADRRAGETPMSLMDRADAALYVSKREGRNRVTSAERPSAAA
jgi:diguanylate cyclase